MTLCLTIDLKKSTSAGLVLTTKRLDRFNLALVRQVSPHLATVGLNSVLVKFTGDGWLIISDDPEDAARLCCLAIIMARQFQREMSSEASLPLSSIPALRLAVCWGRDLPVELPNGQRDFVGNSVRHAVRATQFCRDNEILIDDTVLRWISHDFISTRLPMDARMEENPGAKWEEDLSLHVLEELRIEAALEMDAPEYFVNTLALTGRRTEATALADRLADGLQNEAEEPDSDPAELIERFNRLLASEIDYSAVQGILLEMKRAGLKPDVETFNSVLMKEQSDTAKQRWLEQMRGAGISPNAKTFTILIKQEKDEKAVTKWLNRIRREGITPDVILLNTLIERAPNHATAKSYLEQTAKLGAKPNLGTYNLLIGKSENCREGRIWIDRLFGDGFTPPVETFRVLFRKDLTGISGNNLLDWFLALPYHPAEAMWQAIAGFRKAGRVDDALRLCMDYPHTQAAEKVFRLHPQRTLEYFRRVIEDDPDHPNGNYAFGVALRMLGQEQEAIPYLRHALLLAGPSPRRDEIQRYLDKLNPDNNGYTHLLKIDTPFLESIRETSRQTHR